MVQLLQKMLWFSQYIIYRSIIWSRNSTSGCLPKRNESRDANRYLYTHVHSVLTTTAKRQKQHSIHQHINKIWYTHTMLLSLKRKEILTHVAVLMNLGDSWLSERSQSHEDKYYTFLLTKGPWNSQIHREKIDWWSPGAGRNGELAFNGKWVSAGKIKFWRQM